MNAVEHALRHRILGRMNHERERIDRMTSRAQAKQAHAIWERRMMKYADATHQGGIQKYWGYLCLNILLL